MGIFRDTGAAYIQVENSGMGARSLCLQSYAGNVGIGTTTPGYPLHVNSYALSPSQTARYYGIGATINTATSTNSVGIRCEYDILTAATFLSLSDRRIKTHILDIDDDLALALFRRLQPKTYQYVDKIKKGTETVYGFIAQEVRDVLPIASSLVTDTLPNLYTLVTVNGDILTIDTTLLEYDASGNLFPKLKLIKEDNSEFFVRILSVSGNTVQIDTMLTEDKVFVYGQEVDNFHTLNKDAIWTVATAALQEVDRQVQGLDRQLQAEKEKTLTLEQKCLALETKHNVLEAKLEALQSNYEALLARMGPA